MCIEHRAGRLGRDVVRARTSDPGNSPCTRGLRLPSSYLSWKSPHLSDHPPASSRLLCNVRVVRLVCSPLSGARGDEPWATTTAPTLADEQEQTLPSPPPTAFVILATFEPVRRRRSGHPVYRSTRARSDRGSDSTRHYYLGALREGLDRPRGRLPDSLIQHSHHSNTTLPILEQQCQ